MQRGGKDSCKMRNLILTENVPTMYLEQKKLKITNPGVINSRTAYGIHVFNLN